MVDMICNIPSPCCGEDYLKKYLKKVIKAEFYEDSIGNLIVHKAGTGKKVVLNCGIDEDSFIVTSITDGKIFFKHLGNKSIFPGTPVSISGNDGYICCEDKEKPLKDQYISLIGKAEIELGSVGIVSSEFFEDDEYIKGSRIGRAMVIEKLIDVANNYQGSFDLYIVFSIQSLFGYKGALNASNSIESDIFISFEEINKDSSELFLCKACKNYVIGQNNESYFEKCEFEPFIDTKKETFGTYSKKANTAIVGIPVTFLDCSSQVANVLLKEKINNFINSII